MGVDMNRINAIMLAAMLACSGGALLADGGEPAAAEKPAAAVESVENGGRNVKKLRGKLLYKRNQISKLERSAIDGDEQLRGKVESLEIQRRDLLSGAQPKLSELYQEEMELRQQINDLSPRK